MSAAEAAAAEATIRARYPDGIGTAAEIMFMLLSIHGAGERMIMGGTPEMDEKFRQEDVLMDAFMRVKTDMDYMEVMSHAVKCNATRSSV